jgi:hypothetical protein
VLAIGSVDFGCAEKSVDQLFEGHRMLYMPVNNGSKRNTERRTIRGAFADFCF